MLFLQLFFCSGIYKSLGMKVSGFHYREADKENNVSQYFHVIQAENRKYCPVCHCE